jgi:hypothetical protein
LFERIGIKDQEIDTFRGVPVMILDSQLERRYNTVSKQVLVGESILLDVTIASGRPGILNYIEMSNIREALNISGNQISYFGSELEDTVLGYISGLLGRADLIHVPYYNDQETWHQLQSGVPPVLSRLGYKLSKLGFTWFKDFYIAEGWREGPVKLTAEKPVDEEMVARNLASIEKDVGRFLKSNRSEALTERGMTVLKMIERYRNQPLLLLTP